MELCQLQRWASSATTVGVAGVSPKEMMVWEELELFRNSRLHCVGEDENAQVAKEETKKTLGPKKDPILKAVSSSKKTLQVYMLCFQIIQVYCERFFRVIKGRFNSEDRWVRWLMFVLDSLDLFEPQSYIEMEDPQNAKNDKNGAFLPAKRNFQHFWATGILPLPPFVPSWHRPISLDLQSTPDM